jgi:hypothetical protein
MIIGVHCQFCGYYVLDPCEDAEDAADCQDPRVQEGDGQPALLGVSSMDGTLEAQSPA